MPTKEEIGQDFSSGLKYAEIARKYNVSRQRIHQIFTGYNPSKSKANLLRLAERKKELEKKYISTIEKIKQEEKNFFEKAKNLQNNTTPLDLSGIEKQGFSGRDIVREAVRKRDNHTCSICGKVWNKTMRRFDIHHINFDPTKTHGYDNKNEHFGLITLCHKCHLKIHHCGL